ncbi:GON-4-like protein [Melipona quadrifasciata]|uniref:GON-4-like protein n=1 Tax=Melipona quadrifasciata TaxID=166423 RepID=A0A0M8ZTU6_9HYME|nr:GON-4-like protein [Melipona quadrifasciata]
MAMTKNCLHNTEDDISFEPKLTRAKAKELAAAQVNIPWPITPVKKTSSEVQVLIEEELPEDSSDEEYNPEQESPDPQDQIDSEGIFKIPRTRSKVCLSETPLEQIEQAFIPPDITTDMYDLDCELDEDWDNFLKEFTQPLTQEPIVEDDSEADPEYNILEDEETEFLDKEELRADKAVKITRKELNNLIAELFEFTDMFSKQEQEISKKRRSPENTNFSSENNMNCSVTDLLLTYKESELPNLMNPNQQELLAVQFRQHVQLMVQHFAMTYMHLDLHSQSKTCKQNLNSIKYLSNGPNSAFNVANLPDALTLVSDWENKFLDNKFSEDFKKSMIDEEAVKKINKCKYIPKFHPELKKLFMESRALMYPQLLPEMPFRSELNKFMRSPYLRSEENLIALGLEQFLPFVTSKSRKFKGKNLQLADAVKLIIQYLVPCREPEGLLYHIKKCRSAKDANPIKHYFEKNCAPRTIHYITLECDLKAPKDQSINLLPLIWQTYLNNTKQRIDIVKRKHTFNLYNDTNKDCLTNENGNLITISKAHFLCAQNQPVNTLPKILPANNMLPKILPANNMLPKILPANNQKTTRNTLKDNLCTNANSEVFKNIPNNGNNIKSHNIYVLNKERSLHHSNSLKIITTQEEKEKQKDTNELKEVQNDISTNSISLKHSKFSKKSEIVQELPQLRKTTPRLAKTKSAQNMKLMAQVLGPKGLSNCNALKSREKNDVNKNVEKSSDSSMLDNEDEIAELMLASTTIKKDSISRKKAKEARELENIKRLLESENPLNEEERGSKFAASYFQKLHLTLESNPATLRSVIKLYLDYYEKLDNINQMENELSFSSSARSLHTERIMRKATRDTITINLYHDICKKLWEYPELCTDFLLFLKPHQAAMLDKSVEYIMLQKMNEFVNVAQIYFAKQPSRIAKMMQAITQLSSNPQTTLEHIHATMSSILKGHPLIMDLFLQILPTAKPPESLFASHMFENLTCPVGPYDKSKIYSEDAPELYENVELPVLSFQEDPYGGENCKCSCHSSDESTYKNISEHCLRPAKIIFPGAEEEKLENIARVSLKTTDKFALSISSKQRKKSSKNEFHADEQYQKSCIAKNSPIKENEEGEKLIIKTKKTIKSSSKDQKKNLKRSRNELNYISRNTKKMRISQCRTKSEKKIDKQEVKLECVNSNVSPDVKSDEYLFINYKNSKEIIVNNTSDVEIKMSNDSLSKIDSSHEINNAVNLNTNINTKSWTRQEDMILLQTIKKEYSENSLVLVSKTLGNRTIDQNMLQEE